MWAWPRASSQTGRSCSKRPRGSACRPKSSWPAQGGAEREEAEALNCLGEVAYYRQRPEQALELYREAALLWDKLGDERGQARTLVLQGSVYSDLSRLDQAQACYERARPLWASLGDVRGQTITLVAEARLLARRGEYQAALSAFGDALARSAADG
ncbi:MAG: tetratricopeptide repeat protein [Desulfomicrobium escambiense]|nr:tetratricopeptide repeat protein [Desulfomicrobium escambiense]